MKNVFINTNESWWLSEDFKTKNLVSLEEILNTYDMLHDIIEFYQAENQQLNEIIMAQNSNDDFNT